MGFPIPVKWQIYIEPGPRGQHSTGPVREAKFVRRRMGPARAQWVYVRCLFKRAQEQPVRARECDVIIKSHRLLKRTPCASVTNMD